MCFFGSQKVGAKQKWKSNPAQSSGSQKIGAKQKRKKAVVKIKGNPWGDSVNYLEVGTRVPAMERRENMDKDPQKLKKNISDISRDAKPNPRIRLKFRPIFIFSSR